MAVLDSPEQRALAAADYRSVRAGRGTALIDRLLANGSLYEDTDSRLTDYSTGRRTDRR
jgi:hypothetical protein